MNEFLIAAEDLLPPWVDLVAILVGLTLIAAACRLRRRTDRARSGRTDEHPPRGPGVGGS